MNISCSQLCLLAFCERKQQPFFLQLLPPLDPLRVARTLRSAQWMKGSTWSGCTSMKCLIPVSWKAPFLYLALVLSTDLLVFFSQRNINFLCQVEEVFLSETKFYFLFSEHLEQVRTGLCDLGQGFSYPWITTRLKKKKKKQCMGNKSKCFSAEDQRFLLLKSGSEHSPNWRRLCKSF